MDFAQIILKPFAMLLMFFYNFFSSYGIALILFALVVKLILFPLSLKGKKSMIKMNLLSGKMQQLQKQYGRDRERYNLEVQKLYEREKVNPMGGCLWSFLPLLILIPLYAIIRQPIKYMMGINDVEILNQIAQVVDWNSIAVSNGWIKEAGEAFSNVGYNQLYLSSLITPENLEAVKAAVGEVGSRIFAVNFDFLGLVDLARIPTLKFWTVAGGFALFLLPVVSAGSSLVFSFISMKTNAVNQQAAQAGNNASMKSMMIISPLISLWIGFSMPAALCLYWIAQNLLSMVQEFICGKLLKKDYEKAAAARAEQERLEKEEEKEALREAREQEREARKLEREIAAERKKLEKERSQYLKAYKDVSARLEDAGDDERADLEEKAAELKAKLDDVDRAVSDVDYREANQKAGFVYVISNIGSFGEGVYKIGMTRRLEPMDRIRELGDASVPFNFDVHALIFCDDAPKLEAALHRAFEDRKVNIVNQRREFFRVSLDEIEEVVKANYDKTVEFHSVPDAEQYRTSEKLRERGIFHPLA